MKLSLAWLFDHIAGSPTDYTIDELVKKLSLTTAEIDAVTRVTSNLSNFTLARVTGVTDETVTLTCGQLDTESILPRRSDVVEGAVYFVTKEEQGKCRWTTLADFHATKEGLVPAVSCTQKEFEGAWQKEVEQEDYILDIDNSSITHRPDLWSHRGFARELAAILGLPMKPEDHFFAHHPVNKHELYASPTNGSPFALEIKEQSRCKRLAGVYMPGVGQYASWAWMLSRLCRVDAKPIDG